MGPPVSDKLAEYVHQCTTKPIEKEKILELQRRSARPRNCDSLAVPQVNVGIWKELGKWHKLVDSHLQATQSLLAQGLPGVVEAKQALFSATSNRRMQSVLRNKPVLN